LSSQVSQMEEEVTTAFAQDNSIASGSMSKDDWMFFHGHSPTLSYPRGTELLQQGAPVREVYFIDSGFLKSVYLDHSGRQIIVGLCLPGAMVGTASVIVQRPSPVTVATMTRCQLCRITAKEFLLLVKTSPQFAWYVQKEQSREIYKQVACTVELGCHSARQRLERLLWEMTAVPAALKSKHRIKMRLPMKYWEIAELVSVTREHLSRLLKQMQEEGLILRKKDWLIIPDRQRLSSPTDDRYAEQLIED
jgi:CRP-like cAMP-binding protein